MKRLLRILLTIALCAVVSNPQMEARGRNNNGGNNSETPQRQPTAPRAKRGEGAPRHNNGRPNSNNSRPNANSSRPNNNPERPNNNNSRPNSNQ